MSIAADWVFWQTPGPTLATTREVSTSTVMLYSSYDYKLVTLAAALAIVAVYAAIELSRRIKCFHRRSEQSENAFIAVAQAVPAIMWTARADGSVEFISEQLHAFSGMEREDAKDWGWTHAVHPDDLAACLPKWEHCIRAGEPLEVEYRLRRSDGVYHWFLVRGNPVRDAQGRVVKWIGTCTDVEDQKNNQQSLEREIRERTEELAGVNTRLQEEIWERDLARRGFDEKNERMMHELTDRSQRATLLAKMGEHLQSCVSRDEVFAAALGFAPRIFPARRGAVVLLNSARNLAEVAGAWNDCSLPVPVFEPSACWAMRTGQPHLVVAGDTTAPCAHAAGVDKSYLCVPILAQGETLGILHFQATDDATSFGDSELSFKTTFASQVGLSITNIRLRDALRTQSIRDPLTGLYNRRFLDEMLEREVRRAIRAGYGLGILMLDLDHFKKFNDTYGHEAGDAVLRESASFLSRSVRAEDFVCRFGGEEFVVVLPMADLTAASARAERIRSRLRELTLLHQGRSLGAITVSVGVAAVPEHGVSTKELLEAADAALYCAKRAGRDRAVTADPRPSPEQAAVAASDAAKS